MRMYLLDTTTLKLREFQGVNIPRYAILSHRWEGYEPTFQDTRKASLLEKKSLPMWRKIQKCCARALSEGIKYAWVDTCCIDKSSSAELSEAVNSMFRWYKNSKICYVYLNDVSEELNDSHLKETKKSFVLSKWFTRGWTLQELIAPTTLVFFNKSWIEIGTRVTFEDEIELVLGLRSSNYETIRNLSIAQRMFLASRRTTTRAEDRAYCLLGIFDVYMPLLYGEGERAFYRLQLELLQQCDDESIFAWTQGSNTSCGLLAPSPEHFSMSRDVVRSTCKRQVPYVMSNRGLFIELQLRPAFKALLSWDTDAKKAQVYTTEIYCEIKGEEGSKNCAQLGIYLAQKKDEWFRIGPIFRVAQGHGRGKESRKQAIFIRSHDTQFIPWHGITSLREILIDRNS